MKLGTSFVPAQAIQLGLEPNAALQTITSWPLTTIRLAAPWREHQLDQKLVNLDSLLERLQICQLQQKKVVLVMGMKALRWPEFYFPDFVKPDPKDAATQQLTLDFIQQTVEACRKFECITHWQVENEPLNPSGPQHQVIPLNFLKTEIELVKKLDPRPIVATAWGNDLTKAAVASSLAPLADIVGIDLYFQQYLAGPLGLGLHVGPIDSDAKFKTWLPTLQKEVWLSELQAEPWEKDEAAYESAHPVSCSLKQLKSWLGRGNQLPVKQVHFWGAEYWLWKASHGDPAFQTWAEGGFKLDL